MTYQLAQESAAVAWIAAHPAHYGDMNFLAFRTYVGECGDWSRRMRELYATCAMASGFPAQDEWTPPPPRYVPRMVWRSDESDA